MLSGAFFIFAIMMLFNLIALEAFSCRKPVMTWDDGRAYFTNKD